MEAPGRRFGQPLVRLLGWLRSSGFHSGCGTARHGCKNTADATSHQAVGYPKEQAIDDPANGQSDDQSKAWPGMPTLRLRPLPSALHPPGLGRAVTTSSRVPPLRAADDDLREFGGIEYARFSCEEGKLAHITCPERIYLEEGRFLHSTEQVMG